MSNDLKWQVGVSYCWGSTACRSNFEQHHPEQFGLLSNVKMGDSFVVSRLIGNRTAEIRFSDETTCCVLLTPQHRLSFATCAGTNRGNIDDSVEAVKWFISRNPGAMELNPTLNEMIRAYQNAIDRARDLREDIERAQSELSELGML